MSFARFDEVFVMGKLHGGYVYPDVDKLEELLVRKKMSLSAFANKNDGKRLSRRTIEAIFQRDKRNQMSKVIEVLDLLDAPDDFDSYLIDVAQDNDIAITQWDIVERISDWVKTDNGLLYRVYKLRHVHVPNRFARGKYFDLDGLSDSDQSNVQHLLLRHAEICDRLAPDSTFPASLQVEHSPDKKYFWVIDSWPLGELLASKNLPLPEPQIARFMLSLLRAIEAVHKREIILRNLNPDRVYVSETGVHLTDFEFAKLLDGSPTVRKGEVKLSPYLAPEVGGPSISEQADFFSWAQVSLFAATGEAPPMYSRADFLLANFPKSVAKFVEDCLAINLDERPNSLEHGIKRLKNWSDRAGA